MRPDPGRAQQEAVVAAMTSEQRTAIVANLRVNGRWAVWQQVDAEGLEDPVEIAAFVLRRLYPNERDGWYGEVLDQLRAARAGGSWTGFARPDPGRSARSST